MKKRLIDIAIIIIFGAILVIFQQFDIVENHISFALIPILIAYFLGQFIQRKFTNTSKE